MRAAARKPPKVTDRLNAWALAYDSMKQLTNQAVSPDAAAIAAAILTMGSIDLTDPALAVAANIIGWGEKKEPDGHQP